MGFSQDESLLNGINLDAITDYQEFIRQIRPILIGESGYQEVKRDLSMEERVGRIDRSKRDRYNLLEKALPEYEAELARIESEIANGADPNKAFTVDIPTLGRLDPRGPAARYGTAKVDFWRASIEQMKKEKEGILGDAPTQGTFLEKSAERKALEDRFKAVQDAELKRLEEEVSYWNSDQGKKIQQQQRDLVQYQNEVETKRLERQKWAMSDEFKPGDVLQTQINDEFNRFKESQARAGNIILGDDPTTAVAKGSSAQDALEAFTDNMKSAIERERQSVLLGEAPISQQGLDLAFNLSNSVRGGGQPGPWTGRTAAFQGVMPGSPGYGGISQMALSGQQPYQFQQQLQFNRDQLTARKKGSGMSGLVGSMGGAALGGLLAAPTGGMSIPMGMMLGSQFGGAAGLMF